MVSFVALLAFSWGLLSCAARPRFLTEKTESFYVDGDAIPYVDFDIGESYAGNLPVSANQSDTQSLYFWFFPSDNARAEIAVWLNGGPGCSSLIGLLAENGHFLWQPGQEKPRLNPWSWTKLTNVIWIDQPAGTGFAQGQPTAASTEELAPQFMGFWKNFIDAFELNGINVYLTGESYAGQYIPYFASAMLDTNDTEYFNVVGTMLINPAIGLDVNLVEIPMLAFTERHQEVLQLNSTFRSDFRDLHANYTDFYNSNLIFPRDSPMPPAPNEDEHNSPLRGKVMTAAARINPCLNAYHITETCPRTFDPLFGPREAGLFFNESAVKAAINAPKSASWSPCSGNPFVNHGRDRSDRPAQTVLGGVFERVPMNIIANGALDFVIPSEGALFTLQNVTWAGRTGFEVKPTKAFIVPEARGKKTPDAPWGGLLGAAGEMGTWGWERGVLFADVEGAGHMLPQYNPSAAFRLMEVMLGRVSVEDGMGGGAPWTVRVNSSEPGL